MSIEVTYPKNQQEKDKAADKAIKDIQKEFGEGSIFDMGSRTDLDVPHIPSGIYGLDNHVLGVGGIPRGRIIEVYGPTSSGKTTLALTFIARVQENGERAAFVDVEHALDPRWAKLIGVDVNKLIVSQPDYGEQALEIVIRLVESGAYALIVVDSIAALTPLAEIEGEMGDSHMGLQARMMSQACRKLVAVTNKSNTTVLFINQLRDKIGVVYGTPEVTTGGKAMPFYASVRLDVRRIGAIKDGDTIVGNETKIKAAKNKMSAPFREGKFSLMYDKGFDSVGSVLDAGVSCGVIDKSGAWFSYKGERLGQGRKAGIETLGARSDYKDIAKEILNADQGPPV